MTDTILEHCKPEADHLDYEPDSALPSPDTTDGEAPLEQATLSRHAEFWFTDGSIVLVAQSTMFRVHKTFLSRHSVIFRDMFSLPQPAEGSSAGSAAPLAHAMISPEIGVGLEDAEGCSVVRLHDSPDDVASLLYALYDGP